jgi:hypothetical protein
MLAAAAAPQRPMVMPWTAPDVRQHVARVAQEQAISGEMVSD